MRRLEAAGEPHLGDPPSLEIRRDLVCLAVCALALRLFAALFWAPAPTGDAAEYLRLAEGLLAGRGFTNAQGALTSWRPPLYPALMAPLLATGAWWGEAGALTLVRVAQAFLSTATVVMVYALGAAAGGRPAARWAAVLMAFGVSHVAAVSRLLSETLFTFLIVATVVLLVHATRRPSSAPGRASALTIYGAAGAVLGFGALVRSVALALPLFLIPGLLLLRRRLALTGRGALLGIAAFSLGFMLVLAPWTVRNHRLHGALVPVATQGGATLYAGNHPRGGRVLGVMADDDRTRRAATLTEVDASAYLTAMTVQDWKDDPLEAGRLAVLKTLYFWTPEDWEILPGSGRFNPTYAFSMFWVLYWLVGSGESKEQRASWSGPLWPAWAISLGFVGLSLVFYGSPRFRFPIEPFLAILAAAGILSVERRRSPGHTLPAVAVAATACLSVLLLWSPMGSAIKAALGVVGVW